MEKMTTKLAINLIEGTVQAEGAEDFVRFIYQDFKDSLSKRVVVNQPPPLLPLEQELAPALSADKAKVRKASTNSGDKSHASTYKPKFNSKLNLTGLEQFYDEWTPVNNNEKILVFAVFLRDKLQMAPCTADDIYTCFSTLGRKGKTKVPVAFWQSFHDCKNRTNYIEFNSSQEIHITIPGDNRFNEPKSKGKENS